MFQSQISRRGFLGATALAAGGALAATMIPRSTKRNVIMIICDSMRRDAVGCYGSAWVDTPHVDQFAASGVRFSNAYVCSFPTVLARHDILTGRYTFTYKGWAPLDPGTVTVQETLEQWGVSTALVADTPQPFRPKFGYQRGFGYQEIIRGQADDSYVTDDGILVRWPCDPRKLWYPPDDVAQYLRNVSGRRCEEEYFCARTMRAAARWLERSHRRQPFFLYVDTYDPHEPWDPPRHYVEHYDPGYKGDEVIAPRYDRWRDFLSEAELKHCRALYAGEATLADRWVGHLLTTIDQLGLYDNTLVLILSDHGVNLGEHGYIGKGVIRNRALQNIPLFPEMSRIPMLARFPGCRPGSTIDALVQPVHLAATVLDFLGRRIPPAFSAPSLWPLLERKVSTVADIVVSAPRLSPESDKRLVPCPTDRASITDGRWVLIYSCAGWADELKKKRHDPAYQDKRRAPLTGELLVPLLFDMQSDPECLRDVYPQNRERAVDMHQQFFAFLQSSPMIPEHLDFFRKLEND